MKLFNFQILIIVVLVSTSCNKNGCDEVNPNPDHIVVQTAELLDSTATWLTNIDTGNFNFVTATGSNANYKVSNIGQGSNFEGIGGSTLNAKCTEEIKGYNSVYQIRYYSSNTIPYIFILKRQKNQQEVTNSYGNGFDYAKNMSDELTVNITYKNDQNVDYDIRVIPSGGGF